MSETDDTDVLLLIPPDFFLVPSDSEDSYNGNKYGLVDTLITQVHNLENRVTQIEHNSDISHYGSVSSNSTLIPLSEMSEDFRNRDYRANFDGYVPTSSKSTPQKPRNKPSLTSLPSTPSNTSTRFKKPLQRSRLTVRGPPINHHNQSTDADESAVSVSPNKIDNKKIMHEIDKFLTSVKTIQSAKNSSNAQKNLNPSFNIEGKNSTAGIIKLDEPTITVNDLTTEESNRRFSNLNLKDVDRLLNAIESQEQIMDSKGPKLESLYENKNFHASKESWECGDNEGSVPDLGYGMKNIMYDKINPTDAWGSGDNPGTVPDLGFGMKKIMYQSENNPQPHNVQSDSSSSPTYPTVMEKPCQKINQQKAYLEPTRSPIKNISHGREKINTVQYYQINPDESYEDGAASLPANLSSLSLQQFSQKADCSGVHLFNLADIWQSSKTQDVLISEKEMRKLLPKLEEEKCRRKHCEKFIHELQMKILEMQQRLAVAIQVDSAKDEAILRFHEAWEKVAKKWKDMESERNCLSKKLLCIKQKSSEDLAVASEKVSQYEIEITKALDLVQHHQQKYIILEKEHSGLIYQINELQKHLDASVNDYKTVIQKGAVLENKITVLEKESLKDKTLLLDAQSEISESKKSFLNCQNELVTLKDDYVKIQQKIKGQDDVIYKLEAEKNNLQISLEGLQKNELTLQKEIKTLKDDSERNKNDLRNFYQQQVEVVVKDKLKEFQDQLELAEVALRNELLLKEQTITKHAGKQLFKLTEKHKLEINLIEEKNKEEIRLYDLQFNQMKQQINLLQNKLEHYHNRQTNIAQELHHVMESQWLQALQIINNDKSPGRSSLQASKHENVSKESDQSLLELKRLLSAKQGSVNRNEKGSRTLLDQMPVRSTDSIQMENYETPVNSKSQLTQEALQHSDVELQKYVKLLLDKLPKKSTSSEKLPKEFKKQDSSVESSTSDFVDMATTWQQFPMMKGPETSSSKEFRSSSKPPWK